MNQVETTPARSHWIHHTLVRRAVGQVFCCLLPALLRSSFWLDTNLGRQLA